MGPDNDIIKTLSSRPGLTRAELQKAVGRSREPAWKFLRLLKELEKEGRLRSEGVTRNQRYFATESKAVSREIFSPAGAAAVKSVNRALQLRKPCSYDRAFLESYRPNTTFYLDAHTRQSLNQLGTTSSGPQPAGTYARHILERLLIDLSFNSSRLEGNTYSLLETERLIRERAAGSTHAVRETQMILNHKQAIEYLVENAVELVLQPRTIRALHGLLSENLLDNPADEGRLRQISVAIHDSTYIPLAVPVLVEELFEQLLSLADRIDDPFEQSFFLLVHLPYLQPFSDVNKRTSRLAANIALLKKNLQPLSFIELPRDAYLHATLAVYEERRIEALRDVFVWSYGRSAERYRALRVAMGEPDAFRLKYRDTLRAAVRSVVQALLPPGEIEARLGELSQEVPAEDRTRFIATARQELTHLNDGTFARYQLRPSEFDAWQAHKS